MRLLLVEGHTYAPARKGEETRPDILPENDEKVELIKKRVSRHIDLKAILE